MINKTKRIGYPRVAPATEYVATPPASLSAIAVMVAGPNTEKNMIRLRTPGIAIHLFAKFKRFIMHTDPNYFFNRNAAGVFSRRWG
jgi:hypothetical protein